MTDTNKRAHILRTAESLINGDRADTYGPPEVSFGRIAALWNAMGFQTRTFNAGEDTTYRDLNATDVALALQQLKISRIISSPDHEDSWVDNAGYAALGGEMATRRSLLKEILLDLGEGGTSGTLLFEETQDGEGWSCTVCKEFFTRQCYLIIHTHDAHFCAAYQLDNDKPFVITREDYQDAWKEKKARSQAPQESPSAVPLSGEVLMDEDSKGYGSGGIIGLPSPEDSNSSERV